MRLRTYQLRIKKKMSNRRFAKWLGIDPTSLCRYYNGKTKMFAATVVHKILLKCGPQVKYRDLKSMDGRIKEYRCPKKHTQS